MPSLSQLHDLFRAEDCQAYLHTLRWNERPLLCPQGGSHHVSPWGTSHDRPGCTRDWCHGCERPCNDLTHTMRHQRQRSRRMGCWRAFGSASRARHDA